MKLEYLQHKLSEEAETERFSGAVLVKNRPTPWPLLTAVLTFQRSG